MVTRFSTTGISAKGLAALSVVTDHTNRKFVEMAEQLKRERSLYDWIMNCKLCPADVNHDAGTVDHMAQVRRMLALLAHNPYDGRIASYDETVRLKDLLHDTRTPLVVSILYEAWTEEETVHLCTLFKMLGFKTGYMLSTGEVDTMIVVYVSNQATPMSKNFLMSQAYAEWRVVTSKTFPEFIKTCTKFVVLN